LPRGSLHSKSPRLASRGSSSSSSGFFHVAHLHINNFKLPVGACTPFPGWAYEVTFVSLRHGELGWRNPAQVRQTVSTGFRNPLDRAE
jgi:hypothetical protein